MSNKAIDNKLKEFDKIFLPKAGKQSPKGKYLRKVHCVWHSHTELKSFLEKALEESYKAGQEKMKKRIENTLIGKTHTYLSENADIYRAFENGQEHFKNYLLKSIKDHE